MKLEKKPWCSKCGSPKGFKNPMEYNKVVSIRCNNCKYHIHFWKIQMLDKNRTSKTLSSYMYYFLQDDYDSFIAVMMDRAAINKFPTKKWFDNHVPEDWITQELLLIQKIG